MAVRGFIAGCAIAAAILAPCPGNAQTQAAFDAVSIKVYEPKGTISEMCNSHSDPAMLNLVGCTLRQLIRLAYDLKSYQMPDKGPAWLDVDRFVIQAHTTAPAAHPDLMRMMQPVLASRFQLTSHFVDREAPAYLLEVANHGLKIPASTNTRQCGVVNLHANTFQSDCLTLDDFAEALQEFALKDHPVINRTGIDKSSRYQFNLEFSLDDDPAAGPSIYSALPDQLGLTIRAGKAPVRVLVIDHVAHPKPN